MTLRQKIWILILVLVIYTAFLMVVFSSRLAIPDLNTSVGELFHLFYQAVAPLPQPADLETGIRKTLWRNQRLLIDEIVSRNLTDARVINRGTLGAGYGNQMNGMITGLLLAVVTNSVLLVSWNDIAKHIQEPLYGAFANYTNHSNALNFNFRKTNVFHYDGGMPNGWRKRKDLAKLYRAVPANSSRILINSVMTADFFELATNETYLAILREYGLVTSKSVRDLARYFKNINKYKWNEAHDVVYRLGFEVAHNLLKNFWLPRPHIAIMVDRFVREQFTGFYVIGIHLRFEYLDKDRDIELFLDCARVLESQVSDTNAQFKWFVTSDDERRLELLIIDYGGKILTADMALAAERTGGIGHVVKDKDSYLRAIVDNELLSRCDEFIFTGGSTFGLLAGYRKGEYPLFFTGMSNSRRCERFSPSNPSFRPDLNFHPAAF